MAQPSKRRQRIRRLHDYFFPHARNDYRPHFFSPWSIGVVVLGLTLMHGLYFFETRIVFKETDFLASVLPAVLTDLANDDREKNDLGLVTFDPGLAAAAQLAVNDMAAKGYFAHNSPDGKTPWYWLREAGYAYTLAGQNLAVNFNDSKEVHKAWLNSPTHRANILKREYSRIGIAVANGTYKGREATFVVQYFATPPAKSSNAQIQPAATLVAVESETQPRLVEERAAASDAAPSVAGVNTAPETQSTPESRFMPLPEAATGTVASASPSSSAGMPVPSDRNGLPVPNEIAQAIIVPDAEPLGYVALVATSPHSTLLAVLTALMAITIVLLGFAVGSHLRHQYVETIGGGLALLILLTLLTLFSIYRSSRVEVPLAEPGGSMVDTTAPGSE